MPMSFKYGEVILVRNKNSRYVDIYSGMINGKIKGIEAYAITFTDGGQFLAEYGSPNRHLELEWGQFSGYTKEFIVPAEEITKI